MSSRSWNKVMIIGNVGGEPNIFSTNDGKPLCTFSVATNRSWFPKGATERKEETQWHHVIAFNRLAEICGQILTKGTKVFVSGRLRSREFTNPKGETFRKTEIVAANLIAFEKRKKYSEIKKSDKGI